jgi:hypothetical protein
MILDARAGRHLQADLVPRSTGFFRPTALVCAALFCGCSVSVKTTDVEEQKAASKRAVELFHSRLNDAQFDRIYEDGSAVLKESVPRGTVLTYLQYAHDRFGAFKAVTRSDFTVLVGIPVQVRVVFNSKYERSDATELFIFLRENEKIRLSRYEIYPGTIVPLEQDSR